MAGKLKCAGDPECGWESASERLSPEGTQEYIAHFMKEQQVAARAKDQRAKAKPIDRPTVDLGCSPADWNDFVRRWGQYKRVTDLPTNQIAVQLLGWSQMLRC